MNENYTIPAFAEPITDLPDTPGLTAAELKRRFQAPADEVRLAHNALAECVEGITSATYPDTVTEDMLTDALADKINGKADETSVTARFSAETAARESSDAENTQAHSDMNAQIAVKCEIVTGSYNGSGENYTKTITLGFTPKAVLVASRTWTGDYHDPQRMNLAVTGMDAANVSIVSNGFQVRKYFNYANDESVDDCPYRYIAFK